MSASTIYIITGPTAVGKSNVALSFAERTGGEIVSADSLQVYRHFDIGSDKPSLEVRKKIKHHLIDIVDPDEEFNASKFNTVASNVIKDIQSRGKKAVVCGGTGLYIRALIEDISFGTKTNIEIIKKIKKDFPEEDTFRIYEKLKEVDPVSASKIEKKDRYRIERALSVFLDSSIPLSSYFKEDSKEKKVNYIYFILSKDRSILYKRINDRVDEMVNKGLLEETRKILDMGFDPTIKPLQTIGYSQMVKHINGKMSFQECIDDIKKKTRNYAKRQLTWFRSVENCKRINISNTSSVEEICTSLEDLSGISRRGGRR